jgi:hypothetical protein
MRIQLALVVGLVVEFGCASDSETFGVSESALLQHTQPTVTLLGTLTDIDARAKCTQHLDTACNQFPALPPDGVYRYCPSCSFDSQGIATCCVPPAGASSGVVSGQREITSKGNFVFIGYPSNGAWPATTNPWPALSVSRLDTSTTPATWLHSAPVLYGIGIRDGWHEDVAIRVDGDDRIHLWGGMHGNQMWYQRSYSLSPTSTWSGLNLIGNVSNTVAREKPTSNKPSGYSYPEAATSPLTGDVFYISRNECEFSNSEIECKPDSVLRNYAQLFHYKRSSGTWTNAGIVFSGNGCNITGSWVSDPVQCQEPWPTVPGETNQAIYVPYLPELVVDSQGQVHIAVVWQSKFSGAGGTRHQGTYVRYDPNSGDFYQADGKNITTRLPLTTKDKDSILQWQPRQLDWGASEMFADMRLSVDVADRPVIGYSFSPDKQLVYDPNSNPPWVYRGPYQQRVATWTGQKWLRTTLADTGYTYSSVTPMSSGGLIRTYFHNVEFSKTFVHQSHYDGQVWDTGRELPFENLTLVPPISSRVVQSVSNRSSNTDAVLTWDAIWNVSFALPSIAPTRVQLNPVADSYVRAVTYANDNYGSATGILVKNYLPTNSNTRMVFLKFNLTGQNLNHVRRARLKMYASCCTTNSPSPQSLYPEALPVTAYGSNGRPNGSVVDDSWEENTITWNNKPTLGNPIVGQVKVGFINREYIWDVTTHVQSAVAGDNLVTIGLFVESNTVNTALEFSSRESPTFKPVLVIDDYPDPPVQQNVALNPTGAAIVRSGAANAGLHFPNSSFPNQNLVVQRLGGDDGLDKRDCAQTTTSVNTMSYLKFSLTSLPSKVNRAVLRVPKLSQSGSPTDLTAYLAPAGAFDSWNPATITWNIAKPCLLSDAIDTTTATPGQAYDEFDVTPYVNKRFDGVNKVLSIALYRTGAPSNTSQMEFSKSLTSGAQLLLTY